MGQSATTRVHIALAPSDIAKVNDFRAAARFASQSSAMQRLVRLSLDGNVPEDHLHLLEKAGTTDSGSESERSETKTRPAQITFTARDLKDIAHYQQVAGFKSRSETIRYLFHLSLEGKLPAEHVARLAQIKEEKPALPPPPRSRRHPRRLKPQPR